MKLILCLFLLSTVFLTAAPAPISPDSVAVLFNNQDPESEDLARFYAKMRGIPRANLVGLELSKNGIITRKEYNETLQAPLHALFKSRGWWQMARTPQGQILPSKSKITTLVCMRGVPYGIKRAAVETPTDKKIPSHFAKHNEAAIDSELAMLGVHGLPILGPLNNAYFKKDIGIAQAKLPFMLLVGRIDGPSYTICKRIVGDAISTERRGLWGMCYLDHAKKGGNYVIGDQWLDKIAKLNDTLGIPTVVDKNKETFTTNYPMNNAALYYGWYTTHKNGPLLNKNFKFRRGAFAVHLHSYSAGKLRDANKHWTGPILAHGAAATVGNVFEPYLHLTHHFDILHDRLIKGYSLVEAAYMACPSLSWQTVVIGDPLYRPFMHLDGSGDKDEFDRDYRAIRMANQLWGKTPETMVKKLRTKAADKANANLYEYLGLWHRHHQQNQVAIAFFQTASKKHMLNADRLRQWIYTADIQREEGDKQLAISTLKKSQIVISEIPESKSVTALLNTLDPPATPKQVGKKTSNKTK